MEYWADIELSDKLEEWLLLQGAKVTKSHQLPIFVKGKWVDGDPVVYFGGRQIHFYSDPTSSGRRMVRIFFNERNENARTLMLMLFADAIVDHNFKDMQQIN